jgi:nitroreductase
MKTIEAIEKRKSVRNYTGEPLRKEHIIQITDYIAGLKAPFDAPPVRIQLIHARQETGRIKLGTYGFIGGASDFLTLVYEKDSLFPLMEEAAAYVFEQVILFCTGLGLGTCWLGGSFSRKDFSEPIQLKPDETLRIVSPVGDINSKTRFAEILIGSKGKHLSRKPFESLFFHNDFKTSLSKEAAGIYRKPLEMVRIAPSANNQQPWRIILGENCLHFYRHLSKIGFTAIDLGIALCHFEQTCKELSITGKFKVLDNMAPEKKGEKYVISWIAT